MKKHGFSKLLLLAPLLALSACGGSTPTLTFNANWYRNTALKANIENTLEQLEYEVSFESESQNGFSVSYTDGVYKTELKNGKIDLESSQKEGYLYTTDLEISVTFTLNGQSSESFQDYVHSEVQFLSAAEGLRPVKSFREVRCHAPSTNLPESLQSSYLDYHFSYSVSYNDALTRAETVHTNLDGNKSSTRSYDIDPEGTFLDNEQILFALRGLNLSASSSFRSINSVTGTVQKVSFSSVTELAANVDFEADGERVKNEALAAYSVVLGYSGSHAGQSQTLVYAKTTDASANVYRNVLLSMEVPVLHSLGTMRYTLKKAAFATK